jgi:hypothetical protein
MVMPRIICLCGSTRFYDTWQEQNFNETMKGHIVLSVGFYPHCEDKAHAAHMGVTPEQKIELDELHKRKIDLCDEVLVLNVNNYIGESTKSEIEYALKHDKPIRYLVPQPTYPEIPSKGYPIETSQDRRDINTIIDCLTSVYDRLAKLEKGAR